MNEKTKPPNTTSRSNELDEELAGVLTAISIVSRRLAKKLAVLSRQSAPVEEGGNPYEQDE